MGGLMNNDILQSARAAYPGKSDIEALCLRIRQLERFRDERNEALALNAWQAQKIANG